MSEGWRQASGGPAPASREREGETYYDYIDRHSGPIPVQPTSAAPYAEAPAPEDKRPHRTWLRWLTVATALVAIAIVAGYILVASPDNDVEVTEPTPTETGPSSQALAQPAAGDPGAALETLAEEGTRTAEADLEGKWVVQLSAKQDGLQANGRTWDNGAILSEFDANRERYPEAILLRSSDWSTFQLPGFWITVLDTPYDDPQGALDWCSDAGLDRDNCFAKKISTSEGYEDSTRLNP